MIRRSIILSATLLFASSSLLAHDGEIMEPPDGVTGILFGIGNNPPDAAAFEAAAGMSPAIEKIYEVFDGLSSHIMNPTVLTSKFNNMYAQGQIPQLSLYFAGSDAQFLPMDQGITLGVHDAFIDKLALACKNYGHPLFIAPGYEFNLGGYNPGYFPAAFRYIVDRMRDVHDVDNVAWVWNAFIGGAVNTLYDKEVSGEYSWYPGDEYVNWFGANGFNPTVWATKTPINGSSLAMIEFLDFADERNKPVMILETAAKLLSDILPTSDPNAINQANDLMQNHFGPLFDMLKCEPQMKGFIYLSTDWSTTQWPTWGDHRMQLNQPLLTQFIAEVTGPEYQNSGPHDFPRPWIPYLIQKRALGQNLDFDVRNIPQGTTAALFVAPTLGTPTPFPPYPGKFQLGAPLIFVTTQIVGPSEELRISIPIPNNPIYSGVEFYSQFITTAGLTKTMRIEIQ